MLSAVCHMRSWQKTQNITREKNACVDKNVRMGWYLNYYCKCLSCFRIDGHAHAAAALHNTAAAAALHNTAAAAPRGAKAISYNSHTSTELQAAAARGLDCC